MISNDADSVFIHLRVLKLTHSVKLLLPPHHKTSEHVCAWCVTVCTAHVCICIV